MEKAPRPSSEVSRDAEKLEAPAFLPEQTASAEQTVEPDSAEWERRFERDPVRLAQKVDELEAAADRSRYETLLKSATPADASATAAEEQAHRRYEQARARRAARTRHSLNVGFGLVLAVLAIILAVVLLSR